MKRITSAELRFYLDHISALEPDLVHIHFGPDAGYLLPVICKVSVPTVVSFYGYDASSFPRRYFGLGAVYLRRMFRRVRMILAMSEDMKSDLIRIGCPPSKIRIHHPNGVDLDFFSFSERPILYGEKTTILNIAAMVAKKGQLDLLEAFAYALRRFPHTELRIVGEGFMRGELEERIRGLHLQDHVKLLGHLPYARLPEELSRAHIFCHPSITTPKGEKEGIPSIILEAAATGLPVVATYHAGIPEAVVNGKTGFLVTEHDTASLGRRILELLENPEQRRQMGIAGRRHIQEHFDVNKLAEKRETIYDELLV
jgi:glycosyltransferase involved in cell wall biosynthesis